MLLDSILGLFSRDMGIDLGTANTLVLLKDKGIIINEPSVVAVQNERYGKQRIIAVGAEAKEMLGRTPGDIEAVRPMKDGVIADFDMTEKMIRYFIEKTHKRRFFVSPRIIISVPYELTQVERKAVRESAMIAGAREVYLIEEPMAAAIGANLPVKEPQGNLVVDIGGGTTDIAVYTNGAIRHTAVIPIAGDHITRDLAQALRTPYHAAERIKTYHGVALEDLDGLDEMVEVPSVGNRAPRQIARRNLASVIGPRVEEILLLTLNELRHAGYPEELLTSGIVLTGGASLLRGVVELTEDVFNLPARIGVPHDSGHLSERIRNPRYATAMGLLEAAKERVQQKNGGSTGSVRSASFGNKDKTGGSSQNKRADNEKNTDMQALDLPEPRPRKANIFTRIVTWMRENL